MTSLCIRSIAQTDYCRLLQYAVFVGMATKQSSKKFCDLICFHAMASRFLSSSEDEIRQLLEEKDSKNTKRTYKVAQQVFQEYLLERGLQSRPKKAKLLGF